MPKTRVLDIYRPGGTLPSLRTTYTRDQRAALWRLAESNPTPIEYHRERARILEAQ